MKSQIILAGFAALLLTGGALADAGHSHGDSRAFGELGDPNKPSQAVPVTMREVDGKMMFSPSRLEFRRGQQVKFVIRNHGEVDHEFVIGTLEGNLKHAEQMQKNPDMEHDDPNAKRVAPKKSGEILWKFTKAGEFDFSCLIPGHRESGMFGRIVVK